MITPWHYTASIQPFQVNEGSSSASKYFYTWCPGGHLCQYVLLFQVAFGCNKKNSWST